MRGGGRLIGAWLAALLLSLAPMAPLRAQGTGDVSADTAPDYAAWEKIATRAEQAVGDPETSDVKLEQVRAQVADWRAALIVAQSTNSTRIATLRAQIDALGPPPAEGQTEAPEIAERRRELSRQLIRLQSPGIAADEAYQRAEGLIREIDRLRRERQASELMKLWPSPLSPNSWTEGAKSLSQAGSGLYAESVAEWGKESARTELRDNLPLILGYLVAAIGLIWRGRRMIEGLALRLQENASVRWRKVWALLISLGQIVIPTLGLLALSQALKLTAMLGLVGTAVAEVLPAIGVVIFSAYWLGGRIFPKSAAVESPLRLSPERRREGRFYVASFGFLLGVDALVTAAIDTTRQSEAAHVMLLFPVIVLASLLLARIGRLLRRHVENDVAAGETRSFRNRLIGLFGLAAEVIGIVAPLLGAIGYISAAEGLVFPAALSLALMALIFILQRLIDDLYALLSGREADDDGALVPVLIGFALALGSLPVFALIWGTRMADISELWNQFLEGFSIGATRISPRDFLVFLAIFALGFTLTRFLQGALKSSVLPRTRLDQGGKNALLSGLGYTGIFLSALVAIKSAGIDLSGLAIVAGALSLGIGFGLQNIVQNFVSGIILLIERPVSEGDWIEVGGVQGTVKAISVRSTRIQTFDRTDVIVPNADLVSGQVTNWTRFNLTGRLIVPVSVAHGSDTRQVEAILREIAEAEPLAVLSPPPVIAFVGYTLDAMNFEIRVILRDVNFSLSVRSEMNHEIVRRFRETGIAIPFTQREVKIFGVATPQPHGEGQLPPSHLHDALPGAAASAPDPEDFR